MIDFNSTFVDTNILVYASIKESPFHKEALSSIISLGNNSKLFICNQILHEYLSVITRKNLFQIPFDIKTITARVKYFTSVFGLAEENLSTLNRLLQLIAKYNIEGRHIHDTNIVAVMLENNINRLLTNNAKDFEIFSSEVEIIPLTGA